MTFCINLINVPVPMRDGVKLNASIYLPSLQGRFHLLLTRSPYNFAGSRSSDAIDEWCSRGYAVMDLDTRGRFGAEGECSVGWTEGEDAKDTLAWIKKQDWFGGRIFVRGGSYQGVTLLSLVAQGDPCVVGGSTGAITASWHDTFYTNGVLQLSFMPSWCLMMTSRNRESTCPDKMQWLRTLPVSKLDEVSGRPSEVWQKIIRDPDPGSAFWKKVSFPEYAANVRTPLYFRISYFDLLGRWSYKLFTDLNDNPAVCEEFKKKSLLIIGPWGHGANVHEGLYDYGPDADVTYEEEIDYITARLDGRESARDREPGRVRYFTMVENKWHHADTFPPSGVEEHSFYLESGGAANTRNGDGHLSAQAPAAEEKPDCFVYDPADPVPTCGGRVVGAGGRCDQSAVEMREDVLVYTSDVLPEDWNATGIVRAELYVSSSAPDTDFTVKLVDVSEHGTPLNVCDSIFRVRWSEGYEKPHFLTSGEVRRLAFDVDFTSYVFRAGHKIRIEISSSNFPLFERNLNLGTENAMESRMAVAEQTVHHDATHPSRIILPRL